MKALFVKFGNWDSAVDPKLKTETMLSKTLENFLRTIVEKNESEVNPSLHLCTF